MSFLLSEVSSHGVRLSCMYEDARITAIESNVVFH
ncbi:hypothetical protein M7I_2151 [Glarea lozoyensis 74030]|uniref:Uncharacterized protein n=1 Tax=Glarea lozoyensis (strain ATCC 74030 / MF5533) TaxID=1104152 RepID=H0EI06_GLAL7|nr:hypothetical protein M7I_2151 [Glarea lozoyensis 74030]